MKRFRNKLAKLQYLELNWYKFNRCMTFLEIFPFSIVCDDMREQATVFIHNDT